MKVSNIKALRNFIYKNSGFQEVTVNNVIKALGYPLQGSGMVLNELSADFENCAEYGANCGIGGFIYYNDTIAFFRANRKDIISHMEQNAAEMGTDIISMVQGFGVFRNGEKPTASEVGRALWDSKKDMDLTTLYNVFAWYALEEVSHTWYRYLEENPAVKAELSA
jgi:hypothetical protein